MAHDPGQSWWDRQPEPKPGDSWFERTFDEARQGPDSTSRRPRVRGESWLDRVPRRRADRARRSDQQRLPELRQPPRPTNPLSQRAREVVQALPSQSRKPGGRRRAGQRSVDRRVPPANCPVMPALVLSAFQRRWRGKLLMTGPWRLRGLAVVAVAMSVRPGTTLAQFCALTPCEVMALRMPRVARGWVTKWLRLHQDTYGDGALSRPWLAWLNSRGRPKQIGWAASQTLHRAGLPGWRLSELLRSSWGPAEGAMSRRSGR